MGRYRALTASDALVPWGIAIATTSYVAVTNFNGVDLELSNRWLQASIAQLVLYFAGGFAAGRVLRRKRSLTIAIATGLLMTWTGARIAIEAMSKQQAGLNEAAPSYSEAASPAVLVFLAIAMGIPSVCLAATALAGWWMAERQRRSGSATASAAISRSVAASDNAC